MQETEKEFGPTSWAIDNRTSIYILTVIICIAGLFTYIKLQKEKFPDIVVPRIIVSTIYPGVSPTDMENLVTRVIEKELKGVNGVKKINSSSNQDYAIVDVEFNTNVQVQYAKQLVKDAVDKARTDLPNDLPTPPNVKEVSFSEFPIMNVNLSGNLPLVKLKKYADDIQDQIESLPEITRVDIVGALEQQVNVDVDLYKMAAAHLTFDDITRAIQSENLNVSGGSITVGAQKRAVRIAGQYARAADIGNIFVNNSDNSPIRLGDIATVQDAFKDRESYARLDGKTAITLNVVKRAGTNLIDASDKIRTIIQQDQKTTLPKDLKVTITGDTSNDTRVTLTDLINTIIIGFILVTLILMFFMGTTNALFVGLSVPLSMFLAFLVLPILGFSLNMIVLFSFLLALGIVVDDAIVVIENTHRIHRDHPDLSIEKSAKFAAGEVFVPVLAGTLTTVAPFIPLAFWPGIIGKFMYYLPITLIVTLLSSLIIAFIINPVFAVSFMQREDHDSHESKRPPLTRTFLGWMGGLLVVAGLGYAFSSPFVGNLTLFLIFFIFLNRYVLNRGIAYFQQRSLPAFQNGYARLVGWAVHGSFWRQAGIVGGMIVVLVLSGVAIGARKPQVEFFPKGDPKFIYTYIRMPIGTDVAVTDSITSVLEQRVYGVIGRNNPDVESVITNVAIGANDPQEQVGAAQSHLGKVAVAFKELSERTGPKTGTYMDKIREVVKGVPGAEVTVDQESGGPPVGKDIAIEVVGDDYQQLARLSKKVYRYVDSLQVPGVEKLRSDLEDRNPEIALNVDRERANREGISTAQVGILARTAIFGRESSKFKTPDDEYDIQVRYAEPYRKNIDALMNAPITFRTNRGTLRQVPISAVADLNYGTTYGAIKRKNLKKIITIGSNVVRGFTAPDVVAQIQQSLSTFPVPEGYQVRMGGATEDQQETQSFLGVAGLLAIGLIFMILVTQFNSAAKPLIILSEIILATAGVLLGYAATGMKISIVMTGVGVVALAGIVVKNGILLIEFTDILRAQGVPLREALVQAGRTRLNPVILTATAAILGLIPLAIGLNIDFYGLLAAGKPHFFVGGESVVFWGPLAWTIIFGLSFATIVTLLIVPVLYLLNEELQAGVAGRDVDAPLVADKAADEEEVRAANPPVLA